MQFEIRLGISVMLSVIEVDKVSIFFSIKSYVEIFHLNRLADTILMRGQFICFR